MTAADKTYEMVDAAARNITPLLSAEQRRTEAEAVAITVPKKNEGMTGEPIKALRKNHKTVNHTA